MSEPRRGEQWIDLAAYAGAIVGPAPLTAILVRVGPRERDYVFLYMGMVAVLALLRGLLPALLCAEAAFSLSITTSCLRSAPSPSPTSRIS